MNDRKWQEGGESLEKFGDIRPGTGNGRMRMRHLPTTRQPETTPEILAQREAKEQFKIKRAK